MSMGSTAHLFKNFDIGGQPGTNKVTSLEPNAMFAEICKSTGSGGTTVDSSKASPAAATEESKTPKPAEPA